MTFGPFQQRQPDEKKIRRNVPSAPSCRLPRVAWDDTSDEMTTVEPGDVDDQKENEDFAGDADPRQWEDDSRWDDQ
jgi:hypothetical protein